MNRKLMLALVVILMTTPLFAFVVPHPAEAQSGRYSGQECSMPGQIDGAWLCCSAVVYGYPAWLPNVPMNQSTCFGSSNQAPPPSSRPVSTPPPTTSTTPWAPSTPWWNGLTPEEQNEEAWNEIGLIISIPMPFLVGELFYAWWTSPPAPTSAPAPAPAIVAPTTPSPILDWIGGELKKDIEKWNDWNPCWSCLFGP